VTSFGDGEIAEGVEGDSVRCWFCNTEPAEAGVLIQGRVLSGGTAALICERCVELCTWIVQRETMCGDPPGNAGRQIRSLWAANESELERPVARPTTPSFKETSDAAVEILRRMTEERQALLEKRIGQSPSIRTSLEEDIIRFPGL
jgi:hypothetical protein